jgi:hypothetical protein
VLHGKAATLSLRLCQRFEGPELPECQQRVSNQIDIAHYLDWMVHIDLYSTLNSHVVPVDGQNGPSSW